MLATLMFLLSLGEVLLYQMVSYNLPVSVFGIFVGRWSELMLTYIPPPLIASVNG